MLFFLPKVLPQKCVLVMQMTFKRYFWLRVPLYFHDDDFKDGWLVKLPIKQWRRCSEVTIDSHTEWLEGFAEVKEKESVKSETNVPETVWHLLPACFKFMT